MNIQETVLNILEDITGTDEVVNNQDIQLFEEGLLDSLATVQLLVEIEGQLGIQVPVSTLTVKYGEHQNKSFNKWKLYNNV